MGIKIVPCKLLLQFCGQTRTKATAEPGDKVEEAVTSSVRNEGEESMRHPKPYEL